MDGKPENLPEALLVTLCTRMQGVGMHTIITSCVPDSSDPWEHVRGIVPVSLCDWPGRVCTVLFLGGCTLRCPTCHNAQLAWQWNDLPRVQQQACLADLAQRRKWLDGLVVSGGEPTCTPQLPRLLADLNSLGLPVKLDSNGTQPEFLADLLEAGLIQAVAVDVKGPWVLYPQLTGGAWSAQAARTALTAVFALAQRYPGQVLLRCTKVPLLSPADLEETRAQVPADLELHWQDFIPVRA